MDIQRGIPIQESQEATGDVESDIYPDHSQLGTAVIICNVNFETGSAPRRAAKLDIDRLCVVLREIGFHVDTPHVDKTDLEMVKILQDGEYGVDHVTVSGGGIIFGEWGNSVIEGSFESSTRKSRWLGHVIHLIEANLYLIC